jgi:hypothetical protein
MVEPAHVRATTRAEREYPVTQLLASFRASERGDDEAALAAIRNTRASGSILCES